MRNVWIEPMIGEEARLAAEFVAAVERYLGLVVEVDAAARRLGL